MNPIYLEIDLSGGKTYIGRPFETIDAALKYMFEKLFSKSIIVEYAQLTVGELVVLTYNKDGIVQVIN